MIVSFFILILVILLISALFLFLCGILIPSLNQEGLYVGELFFAPDETESADLKEINRRIASTKRAIIRCSSNKEFATKTLAYEGAKNCHIFVNLYASPSDCPHCCCGLGSCVSACIYSAIKIVNNTAVVTSDCNGCGLCLDSCPLKLIELIDSHSPISCRGCNYEHTSCSMRNAPVDTEAAPPVSGPVRRAASFIARLIERAEKRGQKGNQ